MPPDFGVPPVFGAESLVLWNGWRGPPQSCRRGPTGAGSGERVEKCGRNSGFLPGCRYTGRWCSSPGHRDPRRRWAAYPPAPPADGWRDGGRDRAVLSYRPGCCTIAAAFPLHSDIYGKGRFFAAHGYHPFMYLLIRGQLCLHLVPGGRAHMAPLRVVVKAPTVFAKSNIRVSVSLEREAISVPSSSRRVMNPR